jgi:hypothetical protein
MYAPLEEYLETSCVKVGHVAFETPPRGIAAPHAAASSETLDWPQLFEVQSTLLGETLSWPRIITTDLSPIRYA